MAVVSSFLRQLTQWRFSILAFLTIWLLYGLTLNASNLVEFNLQQMGVEAIVERGVFYVDGSPTPQLQPGGDVFELGDHLYAAKQPGQFMAGALVYFFLYRLGLTYLSDFLLTSALVTWFTSGLVTAFATVVLFHIARTLAREHSARWALGATAAFAFATLAFPYALVAHHDAIASSYLLIALGCVLRLTQSPTQRDVWFAALGGALLGLTITTSILPLFMVMVVGLYFLSLRRWTLILPFVIGGALGLAPLLFYDWANFGNPLLLPNIAGNFSDTFFELDAANFLSKVQFYTQQLVWYAPVVLAGALGILFLPRAHRRTQLVMLAMLAVLIGYVFNIDTEGDCQYGPRYLLPAMPYAALGLVGWSYLARRWLRAAVVVGVSALGVFSLVVNTTGALYGVMFCDLQIYAFTKYLSDAAQGKFESLPLLVPLLPWFALIAAVWVIALNANVIRRRNESARSLPWYLRFAGVLLSVPALILATLYTATFLRFYHLWELPPGLAPDEAFYALDALRVLRTGYVSAFFAQNGGREPLFIYMQSGALALLGAQEWVVRIVPAMVGILTVALMYPLGRRLFSDSPYARYIGLASAAGMAVIYWHVNFSRIGFRAILLPFVSAVAVWLFWRGWQNRRVRDLAASGLMLGVAFYTYLSARLLPFVFVGFAILIGVFYFWDRWRAHSTSKRAGAQTDLRFTVLSLGIVLACAAVVALPLALYFYQHPGDFVGRSVALTLTSENLAQEGYAPDVTPELVLQENIGKVARTFIDTGDPNIRHNLPGRPGLDPLMALGFFVALIAGIWNLKRAPVYVLLFLWILVNIAPSVLTTPAPHFLRMIGALPPVLLLVGDGLVRIWSRAAPRFGWTSLIVLILLFSGTLTFRDYFLVMPTFPSVRTDAFDTAAAAVGQQIKSITANVDVLLPTRVYGSPSMQFALADDFAATANWDASVPLDKPLVAAQNKGDQQWVLLHRDADGHGTVYYTATMPGVGDLRTTRTLPISDGNGDNLGSIVLLKNQAKTMIRPPTPEQQAGVRFGNGLDLIGYEIAPTELSPDQTVQLKLYWQPESDLDRDYSIFVHVIDKDGTQIGEWDGQPMFGFFTTGLWRRGMIISDLYPIHISEDAAPGDYKFELGWLSAEDRVATLDAQGNELDDKVILGELKVKP